MTFMCTVSGYTPRRNTPTTPLGFDVIQWGVATLVLAPAAEVEVAQEGHVLKHFDVLKAMEHVPSRVDDLQFAVMDQVRRQAGQLVVVDAQLGQLVALLQAPLHRRELVVRDGELSDRNIIWIQRTKRGERSWWSRLCVERWQLAPSRETKPVRVSIKHVPDVGSNHRGEESIFLGGREHIPDTWFAQSRGTSTLEEVGERVWERGDTRGCYS
eukprot:4080864-Pyramimonas_sp.AAC.2